MAIGTSPTSHGEPHTYSLILQPLHRFTYVTAHSTSLPLFHLRQRHFTTSAGEPSMAEPHSPTLTSLHLCHNSFSKPLSRFTYVIAHSTTLPLLHLRHRHFTYVTWRAAHDSLILQPLHSFTYVTGYSPTPRRFTYVTAHSTTFRCFIYVTGISLRHLLSRTWQSLILQPLHRFTYVTTHSPNPLAASHT